MKNVFFKSLIFIYIVFFYSILSANNLVKKDNKEADVLLKLEQKNIYDENQKYNEVEKYDENSEIKKKPDLDIGVDVDVNKEEKTIDKFKIDIGKNF